MAVFGIPTYINNDFCGRTLELYICPRKKKEKESRHYRNCIKKEGKRK